MLYHLVCHFLVYLVHLATMSCKLVYDFGVNIIGGIAGALLLLWLTQRHKSPALFMKPHVPKKSPYRGSKKRDLSVEVHNRATPRLAGLFLDREPALHCRAWLTFHRCDRELLNEEDFSPEDFIGRWTDADKPQVVKGKLAGEQRAFDIPVDEYARVDVVARLQDDEVCYVWNNDSFRDGLTNEERRLDKGRYLVRVRLKTAGRESLEIFWLRNDLRFEKFRLDPVDEDDPLRCVPLKRWPRP